MTKIKKLKIEYLFLLIFILMTSCGALVKGVANGKLTEKKGAIPPDFGKDTNSVMVFITSNRSYNKYLKKNVSKIYKGKYIFVSLDEFESNEKYNDIDKYRFVFDYNNQMPGYNVVRSDGSIRAPLYNVKKFSIEDRKEKKIYRSKITSSYWSKIQKVYLKKLNEKLESEKTK